jgi:hypothetical protein
VQCVASQQQFHIYSKWTQRWRMKSPEDHISKISYMHSSWSTPTALFKWSQYPRICFRTLLSVGLHSALHNPQPLKCQLSTPLAWIALIFRTTLTHQPMVSISRDPLLCSYATRSSLNVPCIWAVQLRVKHRISLDTWGFKSVTSQCSTVLVVIQAHVRRAALSACSYIKKNRYKGAGVAQSV